MTAGEAWQDAAEAETQAEGASSPHVAMQPVMPVKRGLKLTEIGASLTTG